MDRNFDKSFKLILKHEGGWANNPKDPGGPTMKGVTLATFRRLVKANATKEELRNITDAQLATIYRRSFWDPIGGALLPSGVDHAVFDFAINSGPGRAAEYLQRVVGAVPDGRVGPATIAAVEKLPAMRVIEKLMADREAFLRRAKDKKGNLLWPTFKGGWSKRLKRVREEALAMAKAPAIVDPVVVPAKTAEGEKAVVILPADTKTQPPLTAPPSAPVTPSGWAALIAIASAAAAGLWQYFFGG